MDRLLAILERRIGRHAPANISYWLVGLSGFVYALGYFRPEALPVLAMDPEAVAHGEVWRLFTFLFLPWGGGGGVFGPVLMLFALAFLYTIGTSLEAQWGAFRFDAYYLLGALGTIAASLLLGSITNEYLNASLLLAFAVEFPEYEILLFLILPIRVKWLGWLTAAGLVFGAISGGPRARAGIAVALINFTLFFAAPLYERLRGRARVRSNVGRFTPQKRKSRVCAKCGKSDVDDPSLEFRVCDCQEKCGGKLTDYCLEHARAH